MPEVNKSLSEFQESPSFPIGSLLFTSLEDESMTTGYDSFKVKSEVVANAFNRQYEYNQMATTDKTVVGGISEVKNETSALQAKFVTRQITVVADSTAQYRDRWYGTASFDTPAGYTPFLWSIASATGNHPATCQPSDSTHIRVFSTDQNDSVTVNVLYIHN